MGWRFLRVYRGPSRSRWDGHETLAPFEQALQPSAAELFLGNLPVNDSKPLSSILSVPLSIHMDALSAAGEHDEVAHVVQNVKDAGFEYDAYNWNQMAISLIRAGEPMRAFDIVQKVLIPVAMLGERRL